MIKHVIKFCLVFFVINGNQRIVLFRQAKIIFGLILILELTTLPSYAHTFRNLASTYSDNQGVDRQAVKAEVSTSLEHTDTKLNQTKYSAEYTREEYFKDDISDDEYMKEFYQSGRRSTDTYNISTAQTWNKLTDTRQSANHTTDGVVRTQGFSVGASQWVWDENLQLSLDYTKTWLHQPYFEVLGPQSDLLAAPTLVNSNAVALGSRYLVNPTLVHTISATHVEKDSRPPANYYSTGVKQYIRPTKSALHADLTRAFNLGKITGDSTYGEVNAWLAEFAFLQTLWRGASGKIAYRYYREDEVSLDEKENYTFGTDLVSAAVSQDMNNITISGSVGRYISNEMSNGQKLSANMIEVGVTGRF